MVFSAAGLEEVLGQDPRILNKHGEAIRRGKGGETPLLISGFTTRQNKYQRKKVNNPAPSYSSPPPPTINRAL